MSGVITGGMIGGNEQKGNYKIDARFNKEGLVQKIKKIGLLKEKINISNSDAIDFIRNNLKGYHKVFINFDPPCVVKGSQLYKNSFTKEDHATLAKEILNCKKEWIVTYDECDVIKELYNSCRKSYVDINYSIYTKRRAKEYAFYKANLYLAMRSAVS